MQTLSQRFAMLLVLTVAACGSVGVQGDRCEIGRAQSCPCASGAVGVQECSPAGVYGACVCAAADAGSDVSAAEVAVGPDASAGDVASGDAGPDVVAPVDVASVPDVVTSDVASAPDASCSADLQSDPANCGACGRVCVPETSHGGVYCERGRCGVAGCASGYADCDMNVANGCEASTSTDTANCGACARRCSSGYRCVSGACRVM